MPKAIHITEGRKKTYLIDGDTPLSVCAYCRVSTDKNDQKNSLEAQKAFFEREFARRATWVKRTIFADYGISGTSLKRREEFLRMIDLARRHEYDLILTKEVSRFSRNMQDILDIVTELHRAGVYIWFLTDDIYTEDENYREQLIKAGEQAEAESRKTSRRVRWGQRRQMEKGVVFGRASLLGYRIEKNEAGEQVFRIVPEEAAVVHRIFSLYADGMGTTRLARLLEEEGIKTTEGKAHFTATTLLRILRNEKYVGDLTLGKTYTPDFLTHERKKNCGESTKITVKNSHTESAIISRPLWDAVQRRLENATADGGKPRRSSRFWCSGKLFCGECQSVCISSPRHLKNGKLTRLWRCGVAHGSGKSPSEKESAHAEGLNERVLQKAWELILWDFICPDLDGLHSLLCEVLAESHERESATRSIDRLSEIEAALTRLTLLFAEGKITEECYQNAFSEKEKERNSLLEAAKKGDKSENYAPRREEIGRILVLREPSLCNAIYGTLTERIELRRGHIMAFSLTGIDRPLVLEYRTKGRGESYGADFEVLERQHK